MRRRAASSSAAPLTPAAGTGAAVRGAAHVTSPAPAPTGGSAPELAAAERLIVDRAIEAAVRRSDRESCSELDVHPARSVRPAEPS